MLTVTPPVAPIHEWNRWCQRISERSLTWLVHGDASCCSLNFIVDHLRVVHALLDHIFPVDLLQGCFQGIAYSNIVTINLYSCSTIWCQWYPHSAVHSHTVYTNALYAYMYEHAWTFMLMHIYMSTQRYIQLCTYTYTDISTSITTPMGVHRLICINIT